MRDNIDNFLKVVFTTQFETDRNLNRVNDYFEPFLEKLQSRMSKEEYMNEWEGFFLDCFTNALECCGVESMKLAIQIMDGSYSVCI